MPHRTAIARERRAQVDRLVKAVRSLGVKFTFKESSGGSIYAYLHTRPAIKIRLADHATPPSKHPREPFEGWLIDVNPASPVTLDEAIHAIREATTPLE